MRARNIKPGFFDDRELAQHPFGARILFEGLWCLSDCEGRLKDDAEYIRAKIFPYDRDVTAGVVDGWLTDLSNDEFIVRYEAKGRRYIFVVHFKDHQNPHINEKKRGSQIPSLDDTCIVLAPYKSGTDTVQAPDEYRIDPADSGFLIPDTGSLREESPSAPEPSAPDSLPVAERSFPRKPRWVLDDQFVEFKEAYEDTGGSFIENDWDEAWDAWRFKDFEQKHEIIQGFRAQRSAGMWSDPTRVYKPSKYIRTGECKRRAILPSASTPRAPSMASFDAAAEVLRRRQEAARKGNGDSRSA